MPRKKTFVLKVDPEVVEIKYGFDLVSNLGDAPASSSEKTTSLLDLPTTRDGEGKTYSYLDESKQIHNCIMTMYDLASEDRLPMRTCMSCFWCRAPFDTPPVGCPLKYVPAKLSKKYHSQITKDVYCITDNVTADKLGSAEDIAKSQVSEFNLAKDHDEYFVVDGVFCSVNCCNAYIDQNKANQKFSASPYLLYRMYERLFGEQPPGGKLPCAPHWRLLQVYGGSLTIEEFRNGFSSVEFCDMEDYVYKTPQTRIVGQLFERRVRF